MCEGPAARKDAESTERGRWVALLADLLRSTNTPMGRLQRENPSTVQLLGAGGRAGTLKSRVRTIQKFMWQPQCQFSYQTGPPGLAHDDPENSKRAFWRAPTLQTPPKFHGKTPREHKGCNFRREEEKKREILGLHRSGTPTLPGPTIWPSFFSGLPTRCLFGSLCLCFCGCFWPADRWKTHPCRF